MDYEYQLSKGTTYLHLQRRFCTHGIRIMLWFQLYCSRCRDRNCRRCRSQRKCIIRQTFCGANFDSYFCRSSCLVWFDRVIDLITNIRMIYNNNNIIILDNYQKLSPLILLAKFISLFITVILLAWWLHKTLSSKRFMIKASVASWSAYMALL